MVDEIGSPGPPKHFFLKPKKNELAGTEVVLSVNAQQTQIAGTLDQLSKHPANSQFPHHWLVERLIGMDRQMERGVPREEDKWRKTRGWGGK